MSVRYITEDSDYMSTFNDKYFPKIDIKGKKVYRASNNKDHMYIYDDRSSILIRIFKDPDEIETLGKTQAPWRELESYGLSKDNWEESPQYWVDYMDYTMEEETNSMVNDFLRYEL